MTIKLTFNRKKGIIKVSVDKTTNIIEEIVHWIGRDLTECELDAIKLNEEEYFGKYKGKLNKWQLGSVLAITEYSKKQQSKLKSLF